MTLIRRKMMTTVKVDITPTGLITEDSLQKFAFQSVGKPYRNDKGIIMGEIRKVSIVNGRLIAEVKVDPNVILG